MSMIILDSGLAPHPESTQAAEHDLTPVARSRPSSARRVPFDDPT